LSTTRHQLAAGAHPARSQPAFAFGHRGRLDCSRKSDTSVRLRQQPSLCRHPTARCTRLSTSKRQQLVPNMAPTADFRLHRLASPSFLTLDDDTEQELRNADLLPNPQAYTDSYRATLALSVAVGKTGPEPQLIDVVNYRVSQLSCCAFCLDMHSKDRQARGETEQRR
jgi:AhpD family alkylhydroperoxidase